MKNNIKIKNNIGGQFSGNYRFVLRDLSLPEHWRINNLIGFLLENGGSQKIIKYWIDKLNSLTPVSAVYEIHNLVPTVGLTAIMDHLTNSSPSPSSLKINDVAVGTGTNAPAAGDTTLQTENYRNNVASSVKSNNIGYVSGFFIAGVATATLRECGLFINGSGTGNPDTGTLFSRASINIVKTALQTLTLDYTITLTSS